MALHYRTCPFCEATCGLEIETEGREVVSVRGDVDDVFSHGFICPKAYGVKQLHEDPDRLTTPLVRRDGEHWRTSRLADDGERRRCACCLAQQQQRHEYKERAHAANHK